MSSGKKIIFTGGGSGGHVIPALTMLRRCKELGYDVSYIGSYDGIEARLIGSENIAYKGISTGKLRRYFSWENFKDVFKVAFGIYQSFSYLFKFSNDNTVVVATGGFVIVPVVIAAWMQGKKVVIHEQTSRVGLANKVASEFARKVLVTFESSLDFFPKEKTVCSGYPLRSDIFRKEKKFKVKNISSEKIDKPILFVTGGGNGSKLLNDKLSEIRESLATHFFIVHQVGQNYYQEYLKLENDNYKVFDFIGEEMIDLMKKSSIIISRAGAGTVVELMSLGKPSIFIPLKIAQKNEQYHNAMEAKKYLDSIVIEEDDLTSDLLMNSIEKVKRTKSKPIVQKNPTHKIITEIESLF